MEIIGVAKGESVFSTSWAGAPPRHHVPLLAAATSRGGHQVTLGGGRAALVAAGPAALATGSTGRFSSHASLRE